MIIGYTQKVCEECVALVTHAIVQVKGGSELIKICLVCLSKKIRAGYFISQDEKSAIKVTTPE